MWSLCSRLVLPPNTVKIRGGCSIFPHHKTRRGRSTLCQTHFLPPHAVKTRGGRSTFYHHHHLNSDTGKSICQLVTSASHSLQVEVCVMDPRHHTAAKTTSLLHDRSFVNKIEIYKSELGPNVLHDFAILSYPLISGGWANAQNLYMNIENKFFIPPRFCPFLGGYC